MRVGDCTCLAFYDWSSEFSASAFYEVAVSFFSANGVEPDSGKLYVGKPTNSRILKYSTVAARIKKAEYANASYVGLYHTIPDYAQLAFGWDVTAGYHARMHRDMYFCCGVAIAQLGVDYVADVIEQISNRTTLTYGIGYSLPFQDGPDLYALGMSTGSDYTPEGNRAADRTCAWFRERIGQNRHLQGYLRDVYPLNVISQPHLDKQVQGMPLREWIIASPERGTLRPLAGGAWLWRIEENQVVPIQAELESAGMLIAELGSTRRNNSSA